MTAKEAVMCERTHLWDASECALVLIDYQDSVLGIVFEQDRRVIALNARALAKAALESAPESYAPAGLVR